MNWAPDTHTITCRTNLRIQKALFLERSQTKKTDGGSFGQNSVLTPYFQQISEYIMGDCHWCIIIIWSILQYVVGVKKSTGCSFHKMA